jgi:predicted kinase
MSQPQRAAPVLLVLGGLPGVGKSTIAQALLAQWPALYLRIDRIEQALRDARVLVHGEEVDPGDDVGSAGYMVAYALARDHLVQGLPVLAECVNPLPVTRDAWQQVAREVHARYQPVEVVCSDPAEHRRRVESRGVDIPGLVLPTWGAVRQRTYAPWSDDRWVVDTSTQTAQQAAASLLQRLQP